MPDRPDEFDRDLREEMERMAAEAAPPSKPPAGVIGTARRRIARNSAALVVALALVAGGAIGGIRLTGRDNSGPIPLAPSSPPPTSAPTCDLSHQQGGVCPGGTTAPDNSPSASPSPTQPVISPPTPVTSIGPWTSSDRAMLFLDGVVYSLVKVPNPLQPSSSVVGVIPEDTAVQPPVSTPFGVVVLGGRAGNQTHLWLLSSDRPRELLVTGANGFAVSADGGRLTYTLPRGGGRSTLLREMSLATSPMSAPEFEARVDTNATAVGYVGDEVLLDTGDGASASAATWLPGGSSIGRIDGYGRVIATDPGSGYAVLTEGDGTCWEIVPFGPTGNAGRAGGHHLSQGCGIGQASFDPNGDAVTAVDLTSEDRSGPQRVVLADTTSQLGGEVSFDGAFQTWWARPSAGGPGSILVLSEPEPGTFAILECHVSENICPSDPVWTGTGAGGEGSAWIAEQRPSP